MECVDGYEGGLLGLLWGYCVPCLGVRGADARATHRVTEE